MWLAFFLGSLYTASLTHASLTSLNSSSHLTISESVNLSQKFFFFLLTLTASELQICLCFESASLFFFFFFFLFTFSPSRRLDLSLALCALLSTSRLHQVLILFFWFWFWLLDCLSFIWSFSRSFFFFPHFSQLHLRFSVHVLSFILGSPFHDFIGKW